MTANYSHRDLLDKLGIRPGHAVAFGADDGYLGDLVRGRVLDRIGRSLASDEEPCDVALIDIGPDANAVAELTHWRSRLAAAGGIWLLTRKRGQPGYVDQRDLIAAGASAGLVDNKICSVSDTISGTRFVIRRVDRQILKSV